MSFPLPPRRSSLPAPLLRMSLPGPPRRLSFPEPLVTMSLPAPASTYIPIPVKRLASIVSLPAFPLMTIEETLLAKIACSPARLPSVSMLLTRFPTSERSCRKCPLGATEMTTASSDASPVSVIEFPELAIEKAKARRLSKPSMTSNRRNLARSSPSRVLRTCFARPRKATI